MLGTVTKCLLLSFVVLSMLGLVDIELCGPVYVGIGSFVVQCMLGLVDIGALWSCVCWAW